MENTNIILSQEALDNSQETIQLLIEAANEIASASEQDFQEMKGKKWYKRLWELVTFSKDNEKRIARNVSNLSKLQEIIMKAIVVLANQSANTAEIVKENSEIIAVLASKMEMSTSVQHAIISELEKLKTGIETHMAFQELSEKSAIVAINTLAVLSEEIKSNKKIAKDYFSEMLECAQCSSDILQENFNKENIEDLSSSESYLLYEMVMEYIYLATGDFEYDGDVLDYISINNRKANAIKSKIERIVSMANAKSLLNRFSGVNCFVVDDDGVEYCEDSQGEEGTAETAEESVAVGSNVSPEIELEDLTIDRMLHIREGEVHKFENKDIKMKSLIRCSGTLEFENCVITFNESGCSDEIVLCGEAELIARNCIFVNKDFDEEHFITEDGDHENEPTVSFENCSFLDCSCFLSLYAGSVVLKNSCLLNCARDFLHLNTRVDLEIENVEIENNALTNFNLDSYEDAYSSNTSLFHVGSENYIISYVKVREIGEFRNILKDKKHHYDYKYFDVDVRWGDKGVIENCVFENAKQCIKARKIRNCVFEKCENVLKLYKGAKVEGCKFVECTNNIIENDWSSDGIEISYCEFLNCKNTVKDKYQGLGVSDPLACITIACSKKGNDSKIKRCVFDGIDIDEGFLIKATTLEKLPYYQVDIEDCDFRNCKTNRKSGQIIKTYGSYYKTFGGSQSILLINISSCKGLDRINKESSTCQSETIDEAKKSIAALSGAVVASAILPFALPGVLASTALGHTTAKILKDKAEKNKQLNENARNE